MRRCRRMRRRRRRIGRSRRLLRRNKRNYFIQQTCTNNLNQIKMIHDQTLMKDIDLNICSMTDGTTFTYIHVQLSNTKLYACIKDIGLFYTCWCLIDLHPPDEHVDMISVLQATIDSDAFQYVFETNDLVIFAMLDSTVVNVQLSCTVV